MQRYKATTAQPRIHLELATSALRSELRRMILDDGTAEPPNWSTLRIWGPFEVFGERGEIRHEYRGLVDCGSEVESPAPGQVVVRPSGQPFRALAG